jgi:hypothetical protein
MDLYATCARFRNLRDIYKRKSLYLTTCEICWNFLCNCRVKKHLEGFLFQLKFDILEETFIFVFVYLNTKQEQLWKLL